MTVLLFMFFFSAEKEGKMLFLMERKVKSIYFILIDRC
jgi:hypothetical protein